jgi:hypothetical protein
MTEPTRKMAQDGYSKQPTLSEGYVRKGGSNTAASQIQTRPPAPAPMNPGVPGQASPTQGSSNKGK